MTRLYHLLQMGAMAVLVALISPAVSYGQDEQAEADIPYTMTECEGVDNCATWTFLGAQGNGQWRTGEVANLYFRKVTVNNDKSVAVVIQRADSIGASAGLTATYTGIWRDGRMGGEFTSTWPGHWKGKSGNWYAMPEAPLRLPSVFHLCAHDHCLTYTWENGRYTNYTNLPYQANEKRVLTVKSFTRESIVFHDQETGSYPLTAIWTGRISNEGGNLADGTVTITSWGGKPTQHPQPAPFRMAWGEALNLLPGSDTEPQATQHPPAPQISVPDALATFYWLIKIGKELGGD